MRQTFILISSNMKGIRAFSFGMHNVNTILLLVIIAKTASTKQIFLAAIELH